MTLKINEDREKKEKQFDILRDLFAKYQQLLETETHEIDSKKKTERSIEVHTHGTPEHNNFWAGRDVMHQKLQDEAKHRCPQSTKKDFYNIISKSVSK